MHVNVNVNGRVTLTPSFPACYGLPMAAESSQAQPAPASEPVISRARRVIRDRPWRAATWCLFAVFLMLALANTSEAWLHSHHGWAGSRRSLEARNYLRYGYVATGLKPLDNVGRIDGADGLPSKPVVYWHHPPGVMVYLSLVYALFGEGEIQARLAFVLLSCLTFWLLHGALRRAAGDRLAFLVLALYSLMPIQATYLSWTNFEVMVLFSMAALLHGSERWLERRHPAWLGLIAGALVVGIFGDYPALPFAFFFWLLLLVQLRSRARGEAAVGFLRRYWVGLAFALAVLVLFGLMVWLLGSWKSSVDAFVHLAEKRSKMGANPFDTIVGTWDWYVDFFTPLVYLAAAGYLVDLGRRAWRRELDRVDGYFMVYLASGLTFVIPLKQWLIPHEFGVLYLVPCLAIAGGRALDRLLEWIEERRLLAGVVLVAFFAPMIAFSLPVIHSKRCSPMATYTRPEYGQKGRARFHFQFEHKLLGEVVQGLSRPEERLLLDGLTWRPWTKYYLDREYERVKDAYQLHRKLRKKQHAGFVFDLSRAPIGYMDPLLRDRPHVRLGRFAVVDLTGERLAHTQVRVQRKAARSDLVRYFTSLVHTDVTVATDPWRSLDYALKLGRARDAAHYRERTAAAAGEGLHAAMARFNDARARGAASDLEAVRRQLKVTRRGARLAEGLEMIGYRLVREPDGRQRCTVVVRPQRVRRQNFGLRWRASSRASREWLKKRLGTYRGDAVFDVPPSMWRQGWLYWAEFHVEAPLERYELHVGLEYKDSEILRDRKSRSSSFGLICETLPDGDLTALDARAAEIAAAPGAGREVSDIGGRFLLAGCVAAREAAGRAWQARVVIQAQENDPPSYRWQIHDKKNKERGVRAGFDFPAADEEELSRGEHRVVRARLPADLDPGSGRLHFRVEAPAESSGQARFRLLAGEIGIRFPFHWLVELDAYRWFWK